MKLTNKTKGPKSIPTAGGYVLLQPGESKDIDVSEADLKALKKSGLLDDNEVRTPSIADLQREIASGNVPTGEIAAVEGEAKAEKSEKAAPAKAETKPEA